MLSCCGLLLLDAQNGAVAKEEKTAIVQHRISIGQLRQGIARQEVKLAESRRKEASILDEIERIDQDLLQQAEKSRALQLRLVAQQTLLKKKQAELAQSLENTGKIRQHLQKRLRAFYLMGKNGFHDVVFAHESLPELIQFNTAFHHLSAYDKAVVRQYRETTQTLERVTTATALENQLLEDVIIEHEEEEQVLSALKAKKQQLLNRVATKKQLYQQALAEMEDAAKALTQRLSRLQIKIKQANQAKQAIQRFQHWQGKLQLPVRGRVRRGTGDRAHGILIDTADELAVKAIHAGEIIFAGYMRGFGNTVILSHGMNYHSVVARLGRITVKEGTQVSGQQQIGFTGALAVLFEKGIYLEIRRAGKPVNPWPWFKATVALDQAAISHEEDHTGGATGKYPVNHNQLLRD